MNYKLCQKNRDEKYDQVQRLSDNAFIPFDPANTDYQQFKQAINDDTAQLQDADGNIMSAEDAKQFVSTLP